jgi:hypothetical protein
MHASLNAVDIFNVLYNIIFLFSEFIVIYFFWQIEHVSGMGCVIALSISST